MYRPDFRQFKHSQILVHSAKGSTWEDHKYVKRVDGTYYYPNDYEGGRHISDLGEKDSSKSASYAEYDENDPDFSDANYDKAKRLGDTDFHAFQRDDGTWVILEEDMKWVLPKGVDPNTAEFKKALENFGDSVEAKRNAGEKYTAEDWSKAATAAINQASGGKSESYTDKDYDALAKEVVRGNFGNGQQRKDLLGENYAEVQKRVNEIMKKSGSTKVSEAKGSDTAKAGEAAISKASSLSVSKSTSSAKAPDSSQYMSVYERQRQRNK